VQQQQLESTFVFIKYPKKLETIMRIILRVLSIILLYYYNIIIMSLYFDIESFKDYKKISNQSIKIYKSNFQQLTNNLNDNEDKNNADFLFDTNKILDYLKKKYKNRTITNYLTLCSNLINFFIYTEMNNQIINEKLILKLRQTLEIYKSKYSLFQHENNLKNNEISNQIIDYAYNNNKKIFKVNMTDILDYKKQYEDWINKNRFLDDFDIDLVNKNYFNKIQNFIIICLFTMVPPRRAEYGDMKIISYDTYLNLPKEVLIGNNYLIKNEKNELFFLFGKYKCCKKNGIQFFKVPYDLTQILLKWILFTKSNYLLLNNKRTPLLGSILTRFVQAFKLLTGDNYNLNICIFRRIFLSECLKISKIEREMGKVSTNEIKFQIKSENCVVKFE